MMPLIEKLITASSFVKNNPSLIDNHKPDIPRKLQTELLEINEVILLVGDDPSFVAMLEADAARIKEALTVYQ